MIGHEITHGFDSRGRLYDKFGIFYPDSEGGLWTQRSIDNYLSRQECFIDQYGSYEVAKIKEHVDGLLTLTENIADNGGIRESFKVQ